MHRIFKCQIAEGSHSGIVTVSVHEDAVESGGNDCIRSEAWKVWRKKFGPSIGMAATSCQILNEEN